MMENLFQTSVTTNLLFMSNNIHVLELSGYEAPVIKESKEKIGLNMVQIITTISI